MNTKHTARLAVTAGLCLSMTLSGIPVEAIAEELVGPADPTVADVASQEGSVQEALDGGAPGVQGEADNKVPSSSSPSDAEVDSEPVVGPESTEEVEAEASDEKRPQAEKDVAAVDGYIEDEQGNVEISSVAGLKHFAKVVNGGNKMQRKTVTLTADLNLNNEPWEPIGNTKDKSFNGVFDGGNHVISNLFVEGSVSTNASNAHHGLFGCTANGEIKNLTVDNAHVTGGLEVGAIVGSPSTSKMTNLTLTGDVQVSGYAYVGGMLGRNAYANLTNLTVSAHPGSRVEAQSKDSMTYVGGVVGFMGEGNIKVSNVTSNIDVYGSTAGIGGIAGNIHYGNTFSNCSVAEGTEVKMTAANPKYHPFDTMQIGGIAGLWVNDGNTGCAITDCAFAGALSAVSRTGEDYTPTIAGNALAGGSWQDAGKGSGSLTIVDEGSTTILPGGPSGMQGIFDNITDGTTVKLACDVTANVTIPQGVTATIDLAGHTLTAQDQKAILVNGGNLTLRDSTATTAPVVSKDRLSVTYASGKVVATSGVGITVTGGGSLTMESGTVESIAKDGVFVGAQGGGKGTFVMNGGYIQAREFGIGVIMEGSNATINGGVVMTKDNAALGGNGSKEQGGTEITIAGGTLISHIESPGYIACGIYHPQAGKLTVTGGEIYADGGVGVLMRAGSADITGGTITATGTAAGGVGDKSVAVPSSGIVVERTGEGYPGASDADVVNVSGDAVVKSDESLEAVDVIVPEGKPEKGLVVISGGTFDGKKPNEDLLDNEVLFEEHADGTFGVAEKKIAQIGEATYPSVAKALAAAQNGDTITLLSDQVESDPLVVDGQRSIHLDLDGKTLSTGATQLAVEDGSELEIFGDGTLTNAIGQASATKESLADYAVYVKPGAKVTLNGVAVKSAYGVRVEGEAYVPRATIDVSVGYGIAMTRSAQVVLGDPSASESENNKNVVFTSANNCISTNASQGASDSKLVIYGGTYTGATNPVNPADPWNSGPIYWASHGTLDIRGGVFESKADGAPAVFQKNGTAKVSGGTFTGKDGFKIDATAKDTTEIMTSIEGGTFKGGRSGFYVNAGKGYIDYENKYRVVITGGDFEGGTEHALYVKGVDSGVGAAGKQVMEVSGGAFDEPVEEEFCAPGYVPVQTPNANGDYVVEVPEEDRVAEVDGRGYLTLKEAVDAAKAGQTVKLLKDVTLAGGYADAGAGLELREGITFDGDGHTIDCGKFDKGVRVYGAADAAAKSQFTIKNVTIVNAASYGRCIDTRGGAFDLTLDGVTLKITGNGNGQPLTISGKTLSTSNIVITGGTKIDAGQAGYGIIVFNPVKMTIDGGSYVKGFAALYMKNASATVSGSRGSEVAVTGGATLHGQNVYSGNSNEFATIVLEDGDISVVLDGAKVISEAEGSERQAIVSINRQTGADAGKSTVQIKGDTEVTLEGENATFMAKDESDSDELVISGGTFNKPVPLEHCAPGYGPVDLGNGEYGVLTEQSYTVHHLFEKIDSDEYEANEELAPAETLKGTIGEQTEAQAKAITGFVANEISQQEIGADGKTVVEVTYKRTRHTVSFDSKGGSEVAPLAGVKFGAKVHAPADPVKEGCDFLGWYKAGTFEKFDFETETVTGDMQLVAHWALRNYSVEFDTNGAEPLDGCTLEYGAELDEPEIARKGYTLTGWTDASGNAVKFPVTVKSNLKLTAQWKLDAPTVTITASVQEDEVLHAGDVVTLTAHPKHELDGVVYEYQWYKDGAKIEGAMGETLEVTEDGAYAVHVVAVDGANRSELVTSNSITLVFALWNVELSFDEATVEKHVSDAPFINGLTTTVRALGSTTYTSSDTRVATVDARTGEVTIKGPGKAQITAEVEQTDTHAGAAASYELVVSNHQGEWRTIKTPTCTEPGSEVFVCSMCGEQLKTREISATGHDLTPTPAKDATCTEAGNKEFWTCETCGKHYADAEGEHEIDVEDAVVAPLGHHLQHVEAVDPTVDAEGNIEHWFCADCGAFFADAAGNTEIAEEETVIPRLKVYKVTFDDCLASTRDVVVEVVEGQPTGKGNVPSDPVCEGYVFEGWFYYDLEADAWGVAFDPEIPVTGDVFVAAKWTKASSDESTGTNDESKPAPSKPGETLAQTGDSSMVAIAAVGTAGIASIIAGVVMALKRRRKHSE